MADQDQDRASPEITTDTARPDSVNFIITTGPDVSLTPKQKQFLARKLTITQEKKFAAPFLSSDGADSSDTSTEQASTSLEMVLSKTLEDKYSSGLAFQDDVQLMVDNARGHGALQGGNTEHGNKMLEHVKRFMRRMPSSTKPLPRNSQPDHRVKRPNTGDKRKATESAEMQLPVKKPRPRNNTAPSDAQEKQMRYARNQVEAYRRGINSNHGKTIRNLVLEKVDHLLEEERKLKVKELEKRQRQERTAGLTIGSQGNNKKGGEEAGEVEGAKRVSDTERSQAQPSLEITKLITVKSYQEKLAELSTQLPSEKQMDDIIRASRAGPNFVGRTASLVRGERFGQYHKKTNGHTSYDVLLPAADCRSARYCSHSELPDMTQGELKYMIGNHLIWKDLVVDEFLSYSKDPLFLVVHALRRHHENQGNVTIQFIDRRQAKTPRAKGHGGGLAVFYNALDLCTIFGVPKWSGWGLNDITKLHPRKFTQELLSHGPVLISDTSLQQASIEDLINDGLFEIFSEFDTPGDHKRAGLYTLQVVYRKIGYPPETPHDATNRAAGPIYSYENCARQVPMTEELLETVRKVTLNFRARPKGVDVETLEPPLHAFIGFLTFEKRQKEDPVFMEWIKKHYKAQDVLDLYTDLEGHVCPGMTVVADNLPGYMQYLDLIRDCITLFSLEPMPPNEVETQHVYGRLWDRSFAYAAGDDKHHRNHVKSEQWDAAVHYDQLSKARKRRNKKKEHSIESETTSDMPETGSDSQPEVTTAERGQLQESSAVDDFENSDDADALLLEDADEEE